MKAVVILAAVAYATAADFNPPVISLNLAQPGDHGQRMYRLETSKIHNIGTVPMNQGLDGEGVDNDVSGRQDWAIHCEAGREESDCPLPTASAWDKQDGSLTVLKRVYLMDSENGEAGYTYPSEHEIMWNKRSTYLIKYDATDKSGNRAEQLIVALVLDDYVQPELLVCSKQLNAVTDVVDEENSADPATEIVEAGSTSWSLCSGTTATDNADGDVSDTIRYSILVETGTGFVPFINPTTQAAWCTSCTYSVANSAMTGSDATTAIWNTGNYLITVKAHDQAGIYGADGENNVVTVQKRVKVQDTTPPWIQMTGANPYRHECGMVYQDEGVTTYDIYDTKRGVTVDSTFDILDGSTGQKITAEDMQDQTHGDAYTVTYSATDSTGNPANQQQRLVNSVDTLAPDLTLTGSTEKSLYAGEHCNDDNIDQGCCDDDACSNLLGAGSGPGHNQTHEGNAFDPGVNCADQYSCSDVTVSTSWSGPGGRTTFDDRILGKWIRTYTCVDSASNKATVTRTFDVTDQQKPQIALIGDAHRVEEASRDSAYTDPGASCFDWVDRDISHAVTVTGQVVNMRKVGNYTLDYECADSSGNDADIKTRTVQIVDTTCPELSLNGLAEQELEAGFHYIDAGATATDTLDGDITSAVRVAGNQVNGGREWPAFVGMTECAQIKDMQGWDGTDGAFSLKNPTSGSASAGSRTLVDCINMDNTQDAITVHLVDTQASDSTTSFAPYGNDDGLCSDFGMVMAAHHYQNTAAEAQLFQKYCTLENHQNSDGTCDMFPGRRAIDISFDTDGNPYFVDTALEGDASVTSSKYLCTIDPNADNSAPIGSNHHEHDDAAQPGTYEITYSVSDAHHNPQCDTISRTVTVKDTLAPVISLRLKNYQTNSVQLIHTSAGGSSEIDGSSNPASDSENNEHLGSSSVGDFISNSFPLMAELSSIGHGARMNAWVLGALASATAGLALLAYASYSSAGRSAHVTVPV